ncbi:MAG: hypothetical protein KGI57_07070 [Hyphomicrobiales bacterium]|nr:hypothetical protein [Hyphomicrobiales bacterium]MDE2017448.1 hypothetical protein [Hyphomicrobiales bacterium]
MAKAMSEVLKIALTQERLDVGSPEERACFGMLRFISRDSDLISGVDHYANGYRPGPLSSGHALGEWLAWNWWRLSWEPRSDSKDWLLAHNLTAVGEGYAWPNLTIQSDGLRAVLNCRPSARVDAKPFRYLGAPAAIIPLVKLQTAIDDFQAQLLARLRERGIGDGNLFRLWSDVLAERSDPETAKRRKLEALLGRDPDGVSDDELQRMVHDEDSLGASAVEELAADTGNAQATLSSDALIELAQRVGQSARPADAVRLRDVNGLAFDADAPPWRIGYEAAKRLRVQENLGDAPIRDATLAGMAGVVDNAISDNPGDAPPLAFALDQTDAAGRVVFRSRYRTGRRFDLARLIGDRAIVGGSDNLRVATRSGTYRQKVQRAFAAEFLSPFEAVEASLSGDYSTETREDAARRFDVSERTIDTLLVNHRRLSRDDFDAEYTPAA